MRFWVVYYPLELLGGQPPVPPPGAGREGRQCQDYRKFDLYNRNQQNLTEESAQQTRNLTFT